MKGVVPAEIPVGEIMRAALPYILLGLMMLALIFVVPGVATWLPSRV